MPEKVILLERVRALHDSAARARRLASQTPAKDIVERLLRYAAELDEEAQRLQAALKENVEKNRAIAAELKGVIEELKSATAKSAKKE